MDRPTPIERAEDSSPIDDPQRSAFWVFISFLGISMPKASNQRKAMNMVIIGGILFLAFVVSSMLLLFHLW